MDIGIRTRARTILARFESTPAPPAPGTPDGKPIRFATAGAVLAVATFAAIQSYSHIYWLGATHRQDKLDSSLLPLSVDGLIFAASLVLLYASRTGRSAPWLARVALWLGIAVTVAANVAYGIPAGIVGALVSAWPAFAFVLAVELLMRLVRLVRSATPELATAGLLTEAEFDAFLSDNMDDNLSDSPPPVAAIEATPPATAEASILATEPAPDGTTEAQNDGQPPRQNARQPRRQNGDTGRAKVRAKAGRLVAANPAIPASELAAKCGVSERTAQRWLSDMRPLPPSSDLIPAVNGTPQT